MNEADLTRTPAAQADQPWEILHTKQPAMIIRGASMAKELAQKPVEPTSAMIDLRRSWDVEVKMDGICALYLDGRIVTLEGTPLDCATHCIAALAEMERLAGIPLFFHGEYVEPGGFDDTLAAFKSGRGVGTLFLHDMVPLAIWESGRPCELPRRERRLTMERMVKKIACPWVGVITSREVKGGDLMAVFERVRMLGMEGIVIKDPHGFYERKRGAGWFKLKCVVTHDVTVIDTLVKDGSPSGLQCKTASGKVIKVVGGVGRAEFRELDSALAAGLAPIIEVMELQRVGAKNGGQPSLIRIRNDRNWS